MSRSAVRSAANSGAARPVRRQRLHPPDVTRPADQLLDRPAQLPGEMPPEAHRGVQCRRAEQKDGDREPGVVIAAIGLRALELPDGAVERRGMSRERGALVGRQVGGVQRAEQGAPGRADLLQCLARPRRRRCGADREPPADDRRRGRDGAEADQDEEYALVEGEPHRL
jgi:hypothetical protein